MWFCATRGTRQVGSLHVHVLRSTRTCTYMHRRIHALTRQVGSLHVHWEGQPSGLGTDFCPNGDPIGLPCGPVGFVKHVGGRYRHGLGDAMPLTLNGQLTGPLGGFGWYLRFSSNTPKVLVIERVQVP